MTSTPLDPTYSVYDRGTLLPDLWVEWRDYAGELLQFATDPHDYEVTLANRKTPDNAEFVKVAGCTGYDTMPNLRTEWAAGEIDVLDPGLYDGVIVATRQSDGKPRSMTFSLRIKRTPGFSIDGGPADPPA